MCDQGHILPNSLIIFSPKHRVRINMNLLAEFIFCNKSSPVVVITDPKLESIQNVLIKKKALNVFNANVQSDDSFAFLLT